LLHNLSSSESYPGVPVIEYPSDDWICLAIDKKSTAHACYCIKARKYWIPTKKYIYNEIFIIYNQNAILLSFIFVSALLGGISIAVNCTGVGPLQ